MNKVFLAAVITFGLVGSAVALTTHDETHHGKTVAVPGAQKSKGVFAPAAQVTPHGVVVTAPPGSDVETDVDGGDVDISVTPRDRSRGLLGIGFLGL